MLELMFDVPDIRAVTIDAQADAGPGLPSGPLGMNLRPPVS